VCIALIIGAVIAANAGRVLDAGAPAFAAVVLHNLAGLGLGYAAARALRLGVQQRRAIAVEVGMQNSGLAVALATAHFLPLAALPGALSVSGTTSQVRRWSRTGGRAQIRDQGS
jgi:BASS family bile acid:Na+ symporter